MPIVHMSMSLMEDEDVGVLKIIKIKYYGLILVSN